MRKTLYKSFLLIICMSLFGGTISIAFISASPLLSENKLNENSADHTATITVFDQYNSNWNHPAITIINIPCYWQIVSCQMDLVAYCDPDDPYLRAIHFDIDGLKDGVLGPPPGVGGAINCWRLAPSQVRGEGTINPGQTKSFTFDMTNCPFAYPSSGPYGTYENPEDGQFFHNFIPQAEDEILGYFSPGYHNLTTFVSTQDAFMGDTQDSWITIILTFEYNDPIGDALNEISENLDDLGGLIEEKLIGWNKTQCEKYLRFASETVNSMIENHLNCELIVTPVELCILKTRFIVINLIADDTEISDLCDTIMNLIDDLKNLIFP